MNLLTLIVLFFGLEASGASAQQVWYVNPSSGSDSNGGHSTSTAFRSLTFALTQTAPGDFVWCMGGTFSAASGEIFPIELIDGVRVEGLGGGAVFDGSYAQLCFLCDSDITQTTVLQGLTIANFYTGLSTQYDRSLVGLQIVECNFAECRDAIAINLSSGAAVESLVIHACNFSSTIGHSAVAIRVTNGTILASGGVIGNRMEGRLDYAIGLGASYGASITSGFVVEGNSILGSILGTGIELYVYGDEEDPMHPTSIAAGIKANSLTTIVGGSIFLNAGVALYASTETAVADAWINSRIEFNEVSGFDTALQTSSYGNWINTCDVIPDVFGNTFSFEVRGVSASVEGLAASGRNADPNLGGHPLGGLAGLNTFTGFMLDYDLDPTQSSSLYARKNWYDGGDPLIQDGVVLFAPSYSDPLEARVSSSISANKAGQVLNLTAGATTGFVDYPGDYDVSQILVTVDGYALDQEEIEVSGGGQDLALTLPALFEGQHTVGVINPGGQTGTFIFDVSRPRGSSGACFIATAAYGDYESPAVKTLRGLRDEYLAMSGPGRYFTRWYYREGPAAADWIAERPWARAGARVALQPAVWISYALTEWNPGQRMAFAVLLVGAGFALLRRKHGCR